MKEKKVEIKSSYLNRIGDLDEVVLRLHSSIVRKDDGDFRHYRSKFYRQYQSLVTDARQREQYALADFYEEHYGSIYSRLYSKWRDGRTGRKK